MNIQTRIVNCLCAIEDFLIGIQLYNEIPETPHHVKVVTTEYFY